MILDVFLPRFISLGLSRAEFWKLTPREVKGVIEYTNKDREYKYNESGTLFYLGAIMSAEAQAGKIKAFNHYFPSSKNKYNQTNSEQIKINMLNYANAISQRNKNKQK